MLSVIHLNAIMVIVIVPNITLQNVILQNAGMPNDLVENDVWDKLMSNIDTNENATDMLTTLEACKKLRTD
jgi:competence protein ComGC